MPVTFSCPSGRTKPAGGGAMSVALTGLPSMVVARMGRWAHIVCRPRPPRRATSPDRERRGAGHRKAGTPPHRSVYRNGPPSVGSDAGGGGGVGGEIGAGGVSGSDDVTGVGGEASPAASVGGASELLRRIVTNTPSMTPMITSPTTT